MNINGNLFAGGQVVCVKKHKLFDKLSLLFGKEALFVIVHSAVDALDSSYNILVRIVYLGKILGDIAEIAAQLRNNRLVVAKVFVYCILKCDKVAVIAVYKLFKGLCVLLIFNKGFVHREQSVLIISVVEIIIMELLEICLCFGKVLFTPFCNKCVGVVRRSNIYGGKVAYHKSIVCTDCGNGINTGNGRLVVLVVHNRNGVIARLCKYIVNAAVYICGKYSFLPVLRNLVLLGRFADEESKSLCVHLFVKVGGICGFCVCLNGNAVADLRILGYGSDTDKSGAVFNAFGLCCGAEAPSGGVIAAAVFISGVLGSNTGKNYLVSVVELIAAYICAGSALLHGTGININAIDKQCIKRGIAKGS